MQYQESETVKKIYEWHEKQERNNPHNGRLGASVIGRECERFLWYSFRGLFEKKFSGRILRLFKTGHLEEPRFIEELRGIDCTVLDVDEETQKQFEFTAVGGHFVCHPDAIIKGVAEAPATWHIGEFKTMGGTETEKSKDFEKCKKQGVKIAKPEHYAQIMCGMGLAKLTRALYLTKKKATDELYSERIRYVSSEFKNLMEKAKRIITSVTPPERCASRPDDFRCKWCDAFEICWNEGENIAVPIPRVTCRSCCHSTPELDGVSRWTCAKHNRDIPYQQQLKACEDHLFLPDLVAFADPVDSGPDFIEFKNKNDGAIWHHGNGKNMWTSKQLIEKSIHEKNDSPVMPLIDCYPPSDSRRLWDGEISSEGMIKAVNIIREKLDFPSNEKIEPSRTENTEKYEAVEFGNRLLYVEYKADNIAVLWEGMY